MHAFTRLSKTLFAGLVIAGIATMSGCNQSGQAVAGNGDDGSAKVRSKCISQAKTQGYRTGQCAYSFIKACIETQSRCEMESVMRADAALGIGGARSCPNQPTTYSAEFDKF